MGRSGYESFPNSANASSLPEAGPLPGTALPLPSQPQIGYYHDIGDLRLELPKLDVQVLILGVPYEQRSWDVSMLWNRSGYLEGTAFPTRIGNSALTGHTHLASGAPGPFFRLGELRWSDEVVIRGFGYRHIYVVRHIRFVRPKDSSVTAYRDQDWITLLTCKDHDKELDPYVSRMGVQAVLNRVVPD